MRRRLGAQSLDLQFASLPFGPRLFESLFGLTGQFVGFEFVSDQTTLGTGRPVDQLGDLRVAGRRLRLGGEPG